jgi:regulator-associated protein of mTOR
MPPAPRPQPSNPRRPRRPPPLPLQAEGPFTREEAPGLQLYFCEARHDVSGADGRDAEDAASEGLVSKWRQKERLKTTAVALVVCLNIGVDPPDVIKISPCARLECWVDPLSMQAPKALDTIGEASPQRRRRRRRQR